ncbi:MAG: 2-amino-4-hydroxy-6-hydroxymethyldihydropteridine diphosphokinase [Ginsengibacter sp.]
MNKAYLSIGGNIGNRIKNIKTAVGFLESQIGKIIKHSSIYETAAWGNTNQPDFLNQVLLIETVLNAAGCIQQIFSIENKMGRIRAEKNDPRIMDIDILFFNNEIITERHLIIPHPQIQNRKFILIPMNEISPDLVHPVLNRTISNLLCTCNDQLEVRPVSHVGEFINNNPFLE